MPSPKKREKQGDFIARCMGSEESAKSFPDSKQRAAFCYKQWKSKAKAAFFNSLDEQIKKDQDEA